MIELRHYQKELINGIHESWMRGNKHVIMQAPTGCGKCLGKGTPILMYDGTIKKVEDIVMGDIVMGDDSSPRNVTSINMGSELLYEVIPVKGESFICNESHILSLYISDTHKKEDHSIKDILNFSKRKRTFSKLYRIGVYFKEKRTNIDPYLLGLWIAEGSKTGGNPAFTINSLDVEIIDYLKRYSPSIRKGNKRDTCKTISLGQSQTGCKKNKYRQEFRKCLLNNDHYSIIIPEEYKINSKNKRLRLLAGLLDGDGYIHNNSIEICTKFKTLYPDILYLCRSLGLAAYMSIKYVNDVPYYRIGISGNVDMIPNILRRKHASKRKQIKDVLHVGFVLKEKGVGKYYGFTIDGNNRFLLGDFTVTHNTVMFSYMASKSIKRGKKVLLLTHRQELLSQSSSALYSFGLNPRIIDSSTKKIPEGNMFVCMNASLRNRLKKDNWRKWIDTIDLFIADEVHQQDFNWLFDISGIKDKYVIGATATPKRIGNQTELANQYSEIVFGPDVQEMINMGYLCTDKYFSVPMDLKGIHIKGGEYDTDEMYSRYNKSELYSGVVDNWKRICPDTITLCFCVNIQHCINTCKAFNEAGIQAKFIVSDLSKPKLKSNSKGDLALFNIKQAEYENYLANFALFSGNRKEIIDDWKNGKYKILINAGIATTGFDFPPIETIIVDRATTSDNLWLQMVGRGSRISNGKEYFNLLDFGNNGERLGYYRQQREYSLNHDHSKSGGGVPASKECPKCHALVFASSIVCKYCGFIFPKSREQEIVELKEIKYSEAVKKLETIKDIELFSKEKGYSKTWAFRQIYIRFGITGLKEYAFEHNLSPKWPYMMESRYRGQQKIRK